MKAMDALFKKLNFKEQKQIVVLNAPESFDANLSSIETNTSVRKKIGAKDKIEFAIVFCIKQKEIDEAIKLIAPMMEGDAILWMCYPKGSSKKYTCDFNRDKGWDMMGKFNLESVRMVAIDEDWSALRFRKMEYIKTFNRNEKMALSAIGKQIAKTK
ncbi:MAG: hypothetical protein V4561_03680 [Bacteroidota bacterium]